MFNKKIKTNNNIRNVATNRNSKNSFVSYYASKQTQPIQNKKINKVKFMKIEWGHLPLILMLFSFFIFIIFASMLSSNTKILTINRNSNLLRETSDYQEEASKILNESIWNKNKFTINTDNFEEKMKQQFPELSQASITLPLIGKRPVVELISDKPELFLTSNNNVFVLNKKGKAIAKVGDIKNAKDLNLPTILDEASIKIETGKAALSEQDVTFITTLIKQLDSKNIKIESIALPPLASELRIRIVNENYYIKFNLLTDPLITVGQFLAVKKKLDSDGIKPSEYIDSRVEEKIFYK